MWSAFRSEYLPDPAATWGRLMLHAHRNAAEAGADDELVAEIVFDGFTHTVSGRGNGLFGSERG